MEVTRRFWGVAAAGALLAVLGVAFGRTLPLYGTAGVGAVLVARGYAFVRALLALDDGLDVETAPDGAYAYRDDETQVTLSVDSGTDTALSVTVTASVPTIGATADGDDRTITLGPGETAARTTFGVTWPVAGRARFPPATVRVTDRSGLFTERYERGAERTVTVEPRQPSQVHVGEGGDAVSAAFGGHRTGQYGQGTDPAEVRQYVPGDSVRDIDWKATARMAYPHVREYEVESDRRTLLFFDHRGRTAEGPENERVVDYLREVALTVLGAAEAAGDPLGWYAVGDEGLTADLAPATGGDHYREVRTMLYDLAPTDASGRAHPAAGPGDARRTVVTLGGDESAFAGTLEAYLDDAGQYVQRMAEDPLFEAVRTRVGRLDGGHWTLVFTDDSRRTELRETVNLARGDGGHVVVFLAPVALFEGGGLANLDAAYERYVDFESYRRELASLDRVTAYEVAPGDRLGALLSSARR